MKTTVYCPECNQYLSEEAFYHLCGGRMRLSHLGRCKACHCKRMREYRKRKKAEGYVLRYSKRESVKRA